MWDILIAVCFSSQIKIDFYITENAYFNLYYFICEMMLSEDELTFEVMIFSKNLKEAFDIRIGEFHRFYELTLRIGKIHLKPKLWF